MRERMERSVQLLGNLENQCPPVGRLSDELILNILRYCMDEVHREWTDDDPLEFPGAFSLSGDRRFFPYL